MPTDIFKAREKAFEATYFAKLDAELIEKMRQQKETARAREELAEATGVSDEGLLDGILDLGVTASNLEALSLAPLVCVAWANGSLDRAQREAALAAVEAGGIDKDSPSYALFETWLGHAPDAALMDSWREYIGSLLEHLDSAAGEHIRKHLLERSAKIARASGGFMGFGSVSPEEQQVLDKIESALS